MKLQKPTPKNISEIDEIYKQGVIDEVKLQFPNKTKKQILKELRKDEKERILGMKKGIKSKLQKWIISVEDDDIIGFGQAVVNKKNAEIEKLYIKKEYRGKGIAKKIMKKLLSWLRKKKVKQVEGKVFYKNKPSIKLQKKFGFKPSGIRMVKKLK